jgi:hypothetical protein
MIITIIIIIIIIIIEKPCFNNQVSNSKQYKNANQFDPLT